MTTEEQYAIMKGALNERQWRIFLGTEAEKIGLGGLIKVSRLSGSDVKTIRRGKTDMRKPILQGRIRKAGGGRKKLKETDKTLVADLEDGLEPKGDPMSITKWTCKSLSKLVEDLSRKGHTIKKSALAKLLISMDFSLKANKKNIEGVSHPDRDLQFQHIKKTCEAFEEKGAPIISVDCKKKELIGNFKNGGKEWQAKGQNRVVNAYDFKNLSDGKAAPYGVYDTVKNAGFVNVGVDHDTAAFAVESIRRWWDSVGAKLYPNKTDLLITSDGGGSNGVKNRLWKRELQCLANETGLAITVAHLPPATSKWNKIEHRLFSFISINWRAKPLTSLETIIELLSQTSTKEGLTVKAIIDTNVYPTGIKIPDSEMARLNISRNDFHGDWNYTISPQNSLL